MEGGCCRLCAETKTSTKLLNFQHDEQQKSDVTIKLTRLNTVLDFQEPSLPTTVCFTCLTSLEKAYEFVLGVEKAQSILSDPLIVKKIKMEPENNYNTNFEGFINAQNCIVEIKIEESPRVNLKTKERVDSKKQLDTVDFKPEFTWEDFKWKCKVCESEFPTFNELKLHSMEYHNCCNAFSCLDCKINKSRIDLFVRHIKQHRRSLKFACYICCVRFDKPQDAMQHKRMHLPTEYICIGCNSSFENGQDLKKHSTQYYKVKIKGSNREVNDLTCKICNNQYSNAKRLKMHLYTHVERKYTCDTCGKSFYYKHILDRHVVTHEDERPFECAVCKLTFKSSIYLRRHIKVHDGIKPFTCEQCGRTFRQKRELRSHSIIHTDSFPYVCPHCDKKFRFRNVLKQHLYQHTGVKRFSCEICQRDFMNWSNCYTHMKRIHGTGAPKKKITDIELNKIDSMKNAVNNYGTQESSSEQMID